MFSCGACTSAFAEEKALFAAIDRSLHVAVNGEIPTSLVPGVREAILQKEFPTRGMQWRAILTFASACFVAGTVLFWHSRAVTRKEKPPVVASVAAPRGQEKQIELPAMVSPGIVRSVPHETGTAHANVTRPGGEAMVIVSPQEEDGLKKYAVLVNSRIGKNVASDVTRSYVRADFGRLEIAQMGLSELAIQPLEGGEAE